MLCPGCARQQIVGDCVDRNAMLSRAPDKFLFHLRRRQIFQAGHTLCDPRSRLRRCLKDQVQARAGPQDPVAVLQGAELRKELVVPGAVETAHAVQMALEVTVFHKFVQDPLIDPGYRGREKPALFTVARKELRRQDHIADADGRRNGLGKSADIDHPAGAVKGLQGRNGFSAVAELRVIVVLDDIAVRSICRPSQKGCPSSDRHDAAHRKLVGRHGVDQVRAGIRNRSRQHAVGVHSDRADLIPEGFEDLGGPQIGGVLHGNSPVLSQDMPQQHQQVVVAGAYYDLFRPAPHASGKVQIMCDRCAQRQVSAGFTVGKHLGIGVDHDFPHDLFPGAVGKNRHLGVAQGKVDQITVFRALFPESGESRNRQFLCGPSPALLFFLKEIRHRLLPVPGCRTGPVCPALFKMQFCQVFNLVDIVAAVFFRTDIAFGEQLTVGQFRCTARHMKTRCQGTGRREAFPRLQAAASDLTADIFVDLPVEGLFFICIEPDVQFLCHCLVSPEKNVSDSKGHIPR